MKRSLFSRTMTIAVLASSMNFALSTFAAQSTTPAQMTDVNAAMQQDPVLKAMSMELQRSKEQLKLDHVQSPYFVEYSLMDRDTYLADAAFGALRQESHRRMRFIFVSVRIGDYKQDSYFGEGVGAVDLAPMDDDVNALRHQLWLTTDQAYKAAASAYTQKQAMLKQFEANDLKTDDFSRELPSQYIAPVAKFDANIASLRDAVIEATGLYTTDPDVQLLEGRVSMLAQTHYYMNSEGTVLRQPDVQYSIHMRGTTQATDGMRLDRGQSWVVGSAKELPSARELRGGTQELIARLADLRIAPIVDDEYRGPVLFTATASNAVFVSLVGNNVAGRKPSPSQTSRTLGEYASSFKSRVLPEFLSVTDDPTVEHFGGRTLVGSYQFDDQGVKARPISVIEKGHLLNYLVGREPIRDFPTSNGHGRSQNGGPARPSISNIFIKSTQPTSFADMKKKMIDMCRDAGLPYGYIVESVGSGMAPDLLRRVYVKDGREELVRGAEFHELDSRSLRSDLIAAGDDLKVDNFGEGMSASVIGPSVLFDDLQIRRSSQAKDKLPDYPPPGLKLAQKPVNDKTKVGQ